MYCSLPDQLGLDGLLNSTPQLVAFCSITREDVFVVNTPNDARLPVRAAPEVSELKLVNHVNQNKLSHGSKNGNVLLYPMGIIIISKISII